MLALGYEVANGDCLFSHRTFRRAQQPSMNRQAGAVAVCQLRAAAFSEFVADMKSGVYLEEKHLVCIARIKLYKFLMSLPQRQRRTKT